MNTIRFEQAIFTSATRASSEGYRLIAASSGIGSAERRVIQRCAPSHASLTTDSDAARATSFLALPDGRLCVARSTHVGMEQTGRGGRRVYTHLLVLAADDFAAFDSNPFHILRLAEQAGVLTPDVDASGTLDPIALTPQPDGSAVDRVTIGLDRVEPHRLRFVVERLIAGAKLVDRRPGARCCRRNYRSRPPGRARAVAPRNQLCDRTQVFAHPAIHVQSARVGRWKPAASATRRRP